MKKILLTVNNNKLSGIEMFTLLLAVYLDKSKYKVEVGVPVYGSYCEILKEKKIDFFIFENKITGGFTFSGFKYLLKKIKKEKYDIIHAQAGIAPCVIGKLMGVNLLIEHKHGLDFTSEQIDGMNRFRLFYQRIKKYFVDRTLTGCEADRQVLINRYNYNDVKVKVLYNGIENVKSETPKLPNVKFTIGTIGRLTFQKGQEYFIEMAKILKDRGFDFDYHIYGEGEKEKEYKELILKYELTENVLLKGYTKNISETLNSFDLFVLPSRYEGIPYVVLEAMKESVPVLATDVGGMNEVIKNKLNGVLVKKECAEELAEETIAIYKSVEFRNSIIQNARKDFEEKYTIEKTIKTIESVYSQIK
jgi:glycosyltransferase involved in cell wall biosynthesis